MRRPWGGPGQHFLGRAQTQADYQAPPLDPGVDEALQGFIAKKRPPFPTPLGERGGAFTALEDWPVPENPLESARTGPGSPLTQRCRQQGYGPPVTANSPKSV